MTRSRSCSPSAAPVARVALLAATLLPLAARAHDAPAPPEVVAEALFLCDHLPPGGRDLNLNLAIHRDAPDPATGAATVALTPRAQLAMAISHRVGFTADVGLASGGGVDAPGASLKLLLRAPVPGRTGLAASLDVYGSTHALAETEAGLGLGAIRSFGRAALRAGASVATGVSTWSPHLHAGASAAVALGARWRVLTELVTDVAGGEAHVSAGPTVKVSIGDGTSLMAGALFPFAQPSAAPTFALQLTHGV